MRTVIIQHTLDLDFLVVKLLLSIPIVFDAEDMQRTVLRGIGVHWLLTTHQKVHDIVELHDVAPVAHHENSRTAGGQLVVGGDALLVVGHLHAVHLFGEAVHLGVGTQVISDEGVQELVSAIVHVLPRFALGALVLSDVLALLIGMLLPDL